MNDKNIFSHYDLFTTIIAAVVGSSIFSFPRMLSKEVGTDGWFVIILSGLIVLFFMYITCKSIEVNGYRNITVILKRNFGNVLGSLIAIIIVSAGVFIIALEMRIFAEVLKMYLLNRTPTEFIILVMFLIGGFLIRGEIESLIKFNEITFWIMFVPILITIPFVLFKGDFSNILPAFTHEPIEYIKATRISLTGFTGFSIAYMIIPLIKQKRKAFKTTVMSIIFITGFYVLMTLSALIVFSKEYNSRLLWPTLTMFSTVDLPGTFIERWEGIVMAIWIIFYLTTYVNIYYFDSEIIKDVFHLEDVKVSSVLISPIIYVLSLLPENIAEVYGYQNMVQPYPIIIIVGLLPIALIITGLIKSGRDKNEI